MCGLVTIGLLVASIGIPVEAAAQSERFFRALTDLRSTLDGRYGDEGPEVKRRIDEVSASLADWDRSIREVELSVRSQVQSVGPEAAADLHASLGSLYMQRSRFADAVREFEAASTLAPRRAALHLLRAFALAAAGQTDSAGMAFREAWALEPEDPAKAYLALTRSQAVDADLTRIREALIATYRSVIRGDRGRPSAPFVDPASRGTDAEGAPVFALARYDDGFALLVGGQHEKGIARLQQAAANDPLLVDPASQTERMKQAGAALRKGDLTAALSMLETIVRDSPRSSEAHRVFGTALGLNGQLQRSVAQFEAAVRIRPDDERSWIALARARTDSGALLDAVSTLSSAVKAVPNSGELQWRSAGLSVRLERNGDALEQLSNAAGLTALSGAATVRQLVATLASVHQDVARTVAALEQRVRFNLNDAAAHRDLASMYTKQGRLDEAFAELVISAWLNPEDPFTFVALGHSHMAQQRDADAVDALLRAVTLRADLEEAHYALAQALTRVGRRDEGRQHLSEFQRLRTASVEKQQRQEDIALARRLAIQQSLKGEHRQAAQTWMDLIALEPAVAENYLELADALVKAGDLEASIQYLVKAAELDGVAEVHLRLSEVLARLGRVKESALARQTYERLRLEDLRRGR